MDGALYTYIESNSLMVLAPIIVLGITLRLIRIRRKGLFLWDEAGLYREVIFMKILIRFVWSNLSVLAGLKIHPDAKKREELFDEYESAQITDVAFYKFGYIYPLMLSTKLIRQRDLAMVVPSLVFGILSIIGLYLIGALAFGPSAGLLAAAVAAVSGAHTLYSRSALSDMGSSFNLVLFVLMSILFKIGFAAGGTEFFYSVQGCLLLAASGFFLFAMVMFNMAFLSVSAVIFIASEIVYIFVSGAFSLKMVIFEFVAVGSGAAMCYFVVSLPISFLTFLFPECEIETYFKQIIGRLLVHRKSIGSMLKPGEKTKSVFSRAHRLLFYPTILLELEGFTVIAAACIGAGCQLYMFTDISLYLCSQGLVVFALLTFIPFKATRGSAMFLPHLFLFAGTALSMIPLWLLAPIMIIITARGVRCCLHISGLVSAIRRAAEYINSRGEEQFICTCAPFRLLYGPEDRFLPPGMIALYEHMHYCWSRKKIKYLIIDFHQHYPSLGGDDINGLIQKYYEPVWKVEDPCVTFRPLLWEAELLAEKSGFGNIRIDKSQWNKFRLNPGDRDKFVEVYELDKLFTGEAGDAMLSFGALKTVPDWIKQGKLDFALTELKKAKRVLKDNPEVHYRIGQCFFLKERYKWAVNAFSQAVELEDVPTDLSQVCRGFLLLSEGILLTKEDKHEAAIPKLEEATVCFEEDETMKTYTDTCLVVAYSKTGRINSAKEIALKLLENQGIPMRARKAFLDLISSGAKDTSGTDPGIT